MSATIEGINNAMNTPWGLAIGIGVGLATAAGIVIAHIRGPKNVPRPRKWKSPPLVVIAPSFPKRYIPAVQAAMTRWLQLGHKFQAPEPGVPGSTMRLMLAEGPALAVLPDNAYIEPGVPRQGWIVLDLGGSEALAHPEHLGNTRTFAAPGSSLIKGVLTEVPSDIPDKYIEEVMFHELGHALGYEHVNLTGHALHSQIEHVGKDVRGLKA